MKWAYGLMTCRARLEGLLPRTLQSLAKAGFDTPRLFIDGMQEVELPKWIHLYQYTCRYPEIRTHGNWLLSMHELFIRYPNYDRYALFQDDFVCIANLRQYLEVSPYPEKGYLNLLTFIDNEELIHGQPTRQWYPSNQLGRGAVALVFNQDALLTLLSCRGMNDRPIDPKRGWRAVDGGIVTSMKTSGYKEYVHNPSLTQHIGKQSVMGNRQHPQAKTFPGEQYTIPLP